MPSKTNLGLSLVNQMVVSIVLPNIVMKETTLFQITQVLYFHQNINSNKDIIIMIFIRRVQTTNQIRPSLKLNRKNARCPDSWKLVFKGKKVVQEKNSSTYYTFSQVFFREKDSLHSVSQWVPTLFEVTFIFVFQSYKSGLEAVFFK